MFIEFKINVEIINTALLAEFAIGVHEINEQDVKIIVKSSVTLRLSVCGMCFALSYRCFVNLK